MQLDEEEHVGRLCARLQSDDLIFETIARDVYQNAVVLGCKKCRLLGHVYRVLLVRLTLSFASFLVEHARRRV